jgi:hypothetical protein
MSAFSQNQTGRGVPAEPAPHCDVRQGMRGWWSALTPTRFLTRARGKRVGVNALHHPQDHCVSFAN